MLATRIEIEQALSLVHGVLPATPQYRWPLLERRAGCTVWLKHENHTPVGAFKVRGGLTYMHRLRQRDPGVRGVVSATRGNHGQSLAFAGQRYGIQPVIVVPEGNSVEKNAAMQALGAELIVHGEDFQDCVEYLPTLAAERQLLPVPSFDPDLIVGVATYGYELFSACPDLDVVYVPIGLGSGICALIAAREALGLRCDIVGVVSSAAPAYARSVAAGKPVSHAVSTRIADGMACRTPVPAALEIITRHAARMVEVSDDEVCAAMKTIYTATHNVAEGAGAAAFAALYQERDRLAGKQAAAILCGGNVDAKVFAQVLTMESGEC